MKAQPKQREEKGGSRDIILRHPRERKSKCTLEPLRGREDLCFYQAREGLQIDATGYCLLAVDAPVLSEAERDMPLFLPDSTWALLPALMRCVVGKPTLRSLPGGIRTAYPRKSKLSEDPSGGLASVEALYLARLLQGRSVEGLLDQYHWRDAFLGGLKL